jgi:hypothetical protein
VNYEHLEEGGEYSPDFEYPTRSNTKSDTGEPKVILISNVLCE